MAATVRVRGRFIATLKDDLSWVADNEVTLIFLRSITADVLFEKPVVASDPHPLRTVCEEVCKRADAEILSIDPPDKYKPTDIL